MTLYETIFTRRQVRNYLNSSVPKDRLDHILACAAEAEQLTGSTLISSCSRLRKFPPIRRRPIIYSVSATTYRLPMLMSVLYCKRLTCVSRAWDWAAAGL